MKAFSIYLYILLSFYTTDLFADDAYHTSIRNQLQSEYSLTGGSWLFANNESTKTNQYALWNVTMTDVNVSGQPFTQAKNITVTNPDTNPWGNSININTNAPINAGQRAVLIFWARSINGNAMADIVVERPVSPFDKQIVQPLQLSANWTQYMIPFESYTSYASGALRLSIQVGHQVQTLQIGGMAMLNYGTTVPLHQLPQKNIGDDTYHTTLRNQLQADHSLSGGNWLFADTEIDKTNQYSPFNATTTNISVSGQPFNQAKSISVTSPGTYPYSNSFNINTNEVINNGDRALLIFWARSVSGGIHGTAMANIVVERSSSPFDKQVIHQLQFSNNWKQYMIPFETTTGYAADALRLSLQIGQQVQTLQFGGMAILNYGTTYTLNQLPEKNLNDDGYHVSLKNQLQTQYGLTGGEWMFANNETTKSTQYTNFNVAMNDIYPQGQPFTQAKYINVTAPASNPWGNSVNINTKELISAGDRGLIVFWGRAVVGTNGAALANLVLERSSSPFDKQSVNLVQFTSGWQQYIIPFESTAPYSAESLRLSIQVGYQIQAIQIGGMAVLNYGTSYPLNQLPEKNIIDPYHTTLKNQLQTEYNLYDGQWVFAGNEIAKTINYTAYNSTMSDLSVSGQPFTQAKNIKVTTPGQYPFSNTMTILSNTPFYQGQHGLLVFWAKTVNASHGSAICNAVVEQAASPYQKQESKVVQFSGNWTQYIIPFQSKANFAIGELKFTLQMGHKVQEFQMGGMAIINYGTAYPLSQLPKKNLTNYYAGIEPNAQWRIDANNRIEQLRKANLTIRLKDQQGNPISGATVDVDMDCHSFAFGSAVVSTLFAQNRFQLNVYEDKIVNLDGKGHGFNMVVFENSFKWPAWEEDEPGSKAEKINALNWLDNNGIRTRGHALLWPGWEVLPDRMEQNQNNPSYLLQQVDNHFNTLLNNPNIKGAFEEWDVINEITTNRDLEHALQGYQHYTTGREIYPEVFTKTAQLDPTAKRYINDFMTITYGGLEVDLTNRYKQFLNELNTADYQGIGFQTHITSWPVPPIAAYDILEDFHTSYGKEMKITEFDMKGTDPSISYQYMRDFLIASFSHEGLNGFMMWGFWDGAHWFQNSPLFDINWNLKPSGQAFIDQVFNNWWTDEQTTTASNGHATIRGFKGKHTITINYNGQTQTVPVVLENNKIIDIIFMDNSCPQVGTPCNDNDPNTSSDIEVGNCVCVGSSKAENTCNLITNGKFSNNLSDWALGGSGASTTINNEEVHFDIVTPGTKTWNIVFRQDGIAVEQGKTYRLSFNARAAVNRTIGLNIRKTLTPFTKYLEKTINLTNEMAPFSFTFTRSGVTEPNASLQFYLGKFHGDVVIDNIELVETNCAPVACDLVGPLGFVTGVGGFYGYSCHPVLENGQVRVDIPVQTPVPWGIQFSHIGLDLQQGEQYEITFDSRAETNRGISLKVGQYTHPYGQYAFSNFQLGTTMKSYKMVFTMQAASDVNGKLEFLLGSSEADVYFDNIRLKKIGCGATTALNLTLFMEGCYDPSTNQLSSVLQTKNLLPGQSGNTNTSLPYAGSPWNYQGTASHSFDDLTYENMVNNNGHNQVVDWVLLDFRTGVTPSTSVGRKEALLMENGALVLPESVDFLVEGQSYYVKVDHWSHIGLMSPVPIVVANNRLVYDFTGQNSYQSGVGTSAKQISPGVWAMYSGNCGQIISHGYDINGIDRQVWDLGNGLFNVYHSADMNMDGDINGNDKIFWNINNGMFSDLH